MANAQPSEAGVQESVLQWLDSLGWETYDDAKRGATVLDERHERQRSEVIYWDLLAEAVVDINDELTEDKVGRFLH